MSSNPTILLAAFAIAAGCATGAKAQAPADSVSNARWVVPPLSMSDLVAHYIEQAKRVQSTPRSTCRPPIVDPRMVVCPPPVDTNMVFVPPAGIDPQMIVPREIPWRKQESR